MYSQAEALNDDINNDYHVDSHATNVTISHNINYDDDEEEEEEDDSDDDVEMTLAEAQALFTMGTEDLE